MWPPYSFPAMITCVFYNKYNKAIYFRFINSLFLKNISRYIDTK